MRLPKPVGELLTGYLALAVAAIVVAVALQSGRVTGELIAAAVGLLVLAVALALLSARALGDAFAGLLRALPLADRGPTGRTVVTLSDITQRRRLEVLRRDFVANASHELKTPVAALRA